jgi:hypothetical protein
MTHSKDDLTYTSTIEENEWGERFVVLPQDLIDHMELNEGDTFVVEQTDNGLVLKLETVSVPIDLPYEDIAKLSLQAHKKDITLNAHINSIIQEFIGSYGDVPDIHKLTQE